MNPEFPFQAGQVIHLEKLSGFFRKFVSDGIAVIVPDEQVEAAVMGQSERAVEKRPRARG